MNSRIRSLAVKLINDTVEMQMIHDTENEEFARSLWKAFYISIYEAEDDSNKVDLYEDYLNDIDDAMTLYSMKLENPQKYPHVNVNQLEGYIDALKDLKPEVQAKKIKKAKRTSSKKKITSPKKKRTSPKKKTKRTSTKKKTKRN